MYKQRLMDIDVAKGLAIFLVVVGHIAIPGIEPLLVGNDFYFILRKAIYSFHMPFFMFLSGMIFYYTYKPVNNFTDYLSYLLKKAKRILLPFIIFGTLIVLIKLATAKVFYVPNATSSNIVEMCFNLLFKPKESSAISLWYLYVLFEFYIVFPLFLILCNNKVIVMVGICLILYFLPVGLLFALKSFVTFALFFSLGIVAMKFYDYYTELLQKYRVGLIGIFVISLLFVNHLSYRQSLLVQGVLSLPALHSLMLCRFAINSKLLTFFGKYTLVIYLMNTICMGAVTGISLKFVPLTGSNFTLFLPLLVFIGLFLPVVIKKTVFEKIVFLRKLTD